MKKLTSPRLIVPYILLVVVFRFIFHGIGHLYLKSSCWDDPLCSHPIDTQLLDGGSCRWFCWQYVQDAAHLYYNKAGYFRSFFLVDLVYPIVYTLTMLSIVRFCWNGRYKKIMVAAIWIGMGLDYTENFSFATYLCTDISWLPYLTAFATTVKTIFFISNALVSIFIGVRWLFLTYIKPKS
ncbi:MAG: hypothetical protein JST68_21450 [Bacteroidetes bacterium]|nr:hypothetical protein [Bacteroidota bacterium]